MIETLSQERGTKYGGLYALRSALEQYEHAPPGNLELDWDLYQDWPGAIAQEEELLLDYFRKLKFIYLEQETKLRFLADLQDDPETGQEPQILSAADVAQRESECKRVKFQLAEAKARVNDLRSEIDAIADAMEAPWTQLKDKSSEASTLLAEIDDMELELARIKAAEGSHGAMTTAEAEEFLDAQILEMQEYDDKTTQTMRQVDTAKKSLNDALDQIDRLRVERSAAEKFASDARLGGRGFARDLELERQCAKNTATLACLQQSLAISHVEAPAPDTLHIVFAAQQSVATLILRFDRPGGQLREYEVLDREGAPVVLSDAVRELADGARACNNVGALVQCMWIIDARE
ncbi:hypothetical protein MCUN1_001048 [Malassezia cuniculi]|uniref:Kinetochore protein Sos7 coiled-coil domain-containing protein n=1 Tax=Malassezia cuniculi TaxID=948313 RepID=A0AAF0ETQ5_9BASI|nr:hypothetical protein MCUN1_001048 [Malassezia cuniculi]